MAQKEVGTVTIARTRDLIQCASFAVLTWGGHAGLRLGHALPCFSCPYVGAGCAGHCYLMALQNAFWGLEMPLAAFSTGRGLELLLKFGGFLILTLILGKLWCGWICPFGTLQDWITRLRNRLGIRESRWSWLQTDRLKTVKYVLLGLVLTMPLLIANLGLPDDFSLFICQICPAKPIMPLFAGRTDYVSIDTTNGITIFMTGLAMVLTAVYLVGMFFKERFFCIFCPLLALMSVFDRFGLVRFGKNVGTCTGCGTCRRNCPVDNRTPHQETRQEQVMSPECMACMKCAESCPTDGTLTFRWLTVPLFASSFAGAVRKLAGRRLS